jgi:hypothetical protein
MPNPCALALDIAVLTPWFSTIIPGWLLPLMSVDSLVSFSMVISPALLGLFSPPEVIFTIPWLLSRSWAYINTWSSATVRPAEENELATSYETSMRTAVSSSV